MGFHGGLVRVGYVRGTALLSELIIPFLLLALYCPLFRGDFFERLGDKTMLPYLTAFFFSFIFGGGLCSFPPYWGEHDRSVWGRELPQTFVTLNA